MKDEQAEKSQDNKGYTKVPHEYLEAKARIRLHPLASQILSVIERKTFGWHKDWDKVSRRQYRGSTGLSDWDVIRGIAILEFMKIIEAKRKGRGKIVAYKIQTDFSRWKNLTVPVRQLTEKNYLSSMVHQLVKKNQVDGYGATITCRTRCNNLVDGDGATNKRKAAKETDKEKKETNIKKKEIPPFFLSEEKKKCLLVNQAKGFALPPLIRKALKEDRVINQGKPRERSSVDSKTHIKEVNKNE